MAVWCGGLIILTVFVTLVFVFLFVFPARVLCPIPLEQPCGIIFNNSSDLCEEECGSATPSFRVICENNKSVIYFNYGERHADAIIASNSSSSFRYIITGVSPDDNCPIINFHTLPYENVSFFTELNDEDYMAVVRCEKPVDVVGYRDISSETCGGGIDGEQKQYYSYAMNIRYGSSVGSIEESCRIEMKVMVSRWEYGTVKCTGKKCGYPEVHNEYVNGIEVRWRPLQCLEDGDKDSDWYGERKQQLPLRCTIADAAKKNN
ncbi:hypothetical protein TSUD_68980 [Trifolium subterraneum]|uniref:Wall-associated receptor kinase galacturonan-binding domain-containing protein n=1 Tax=Trifolium subterraneum TaxID=3900 RepID=A0A2Z6NSP8_TRISU|nr:hypothetical protein TSUD_68980 [Trifolium subterraneum]